METKLEKILQKEIESGDFEAKIKTVCSWCDEGIPGTTNYYVHFGNACQVCNSRFNLAVQGMKQRRKRNGHWKEVKVEVSREKIEEMLKDRIQEIKLKHN
jgi:formylmethanofuran dehydrogenase subunit B